MDHSESLLLQDTSSLTTHCRGLVSGTGLQVVLVCVRQQMDTHTHTHTHTHTALKVDHPIG